MKKKMAMIMTGVTVASSVAPVFANNVSEMTTVVNKKDKDATDKLVSEVRRLLGITYDEVKIGSASQEKGKSVYSISINGTEIDNPADVEVAIKNGDVTLVIQDKGHEVVDGKNIDYTIEQYETANDIKVAAEKVAGLEVKILSTSAVEVKHTGYNKTITVNVGDDKLNFADELLDHNNKFVGFGKEYSDIKNGPIHKVEVKAVNEIAAEELFDGLRITKEGQELLEEVKSAKYTVTVANLISDSAFGQNFKAGFDLQIKKGTEVHNVAITSYDGHLVRAFFNMLKGNTNTVELVAGDDRFETAIEVSKKGFKDNSTKNIILVGQDAIVDGLAAAPLASAKNAPILLAKKDGVTPEVEAEMLRVLDNTKLTDSTIYIIGGENQISKEAEEKLGKLGTKIERLSGNDRYETSLEIAKVVTANEKTNKKPAFVVGGNGEVDAMSIASQAAYQVAPIVVVNENTVTEDAKEYMTGRELVVVGGKSSVSEEVVAELDALDNVKNNVERLAGNDRQGTNAAVIKEYYTGAKQVYVAKDGYVGGKSQLIDALTAAPLAGKANAPIVLASNNLSVEQIEGLQLNKTKSIKITQIGRGIVDAVVEKLAEILG